mmetsp:Transcript_18976/g.33933  ORF Transcript_18976/g.33933 Transcript_18976/m.33933 type:complete len:387 (-) Transcript_18976:34-1194(-)
MEFSFNVKAVCKREIISVWDGVIIQQLPLESKKQIYEIINKIGAASSRAQGLGAIITTANKLCMNVYTGQRLYLLRDPKSDFRACGILKIGRKKLFLRNNSGRVRELNAMCVLDFYIHESCQRKGLGRRLFSYMLKLERLPAYKFAIDRPSHKFLSFLRRHYGLSKYTPQTNNFVVFQEYFNGTSSSKDSVLGQSWNGSSSSSSSSSSTFDYKSKTTSGALYQKRYPYSHVHISNKSCDDRQTPFKGEHHKTQDALDTFASPNPNPNPLKAAGRSYKHNRLNIFGEGISTREEKSSIYSSNTPFSNTNGNRMVPGTLNCATSSSNLGNNAMKSTRNTTHFPNSSTLGKKPMTNPTNPWLRRNKQSVHRNRRDNPTFKSTLPMGNMH